MQDILTTLFNSYSPILLDVPVVKTQTVAGYTLTEVVTAVGAITTGIGGILIKILHRSDEKLKLKVESIEADYKERILNMKEQINDVEKRIADGIEKDSQMRDKAIGKIETRIEKLSDLIIKLIEKQ